MNTNDGREYYGFGIDNSQLRREAQEAIGIFDGIGSRAEAEGARIDAAFRKAGQAIAAYFSVQQLSSFINSVIKVRGEIESLEISFETLLGSKDKAKELFGAIREFEVKTPMTLQPLARGAQTLLGFGVAAEKVMPILKQIGDISMGNTERFNSLILAFAQASANGRLMGQDLLQMVNAGFNPLNQMSKDTGKSIAELRKEMEEGRISAEDMEKAFAAATAEGGQFYGMLNKQSEGISGSLSNLEGAWNSMLNEIGTQSQGIIVDAVHTVTGLVESYKEVGKVIAELVATYGVYKAAVMTLSVVENLRYQATLAHMAGLTKMQAVMTVLKAKTEALNSVMLKNPYMLAAAAVATLAYGIYKLCIYQTDAEKAQSRLNETTKQFNKEVASEQVQIDSLFARLDAAKEGTNEYKNVKQTIINQYGKYLGGLSSEIQSLKDVEGAYKAVSTAAREAAKARAMETATKNAADTYAEEEADAKDDLYKTLKKKFGNQKGKDGRSLVETYYWQLLGTLDGKEEIDSGLLKQFDETHYIPGDPMTGIGSYTYTTNEISEAFEKIRKARKIYDDTVSEAQRRFGAVPQNGNGNEGNEDKTPEIQNRAYWEKQKKELQAQLDAMTAVQLQTEEAQKIRTNIAEAQKHIDAYSVKTTRSNTEGNSAKEQAKYQDMVASQSKERERAEKDAEFAVEQARIDAMQQGTEKIQAQMELNHKKELEMLDREKEDYLKRKVDNARALFEANPANKGKTFDGSNITLTSEENAQFTQRRNYTEQKQANERRELIERQRTAMNEYLREFGDYMEKRQAIIDLYNGQMAQATTEGEKLTLSAQMKRELSELDIEANKSTSAISQLFGDMRDKTIEELDTINEKGQAALDFLKSGEWDEDKGKEFGITKETFELWSKSPDKLKNISDALRDNKRAADELRPTLDKVVNGLKSLFSSSNDSNKLKQALSDIQDGMNETMQVGQFLSETFSNLGDAFGSDALSGIANGINVAMDAASSAMSGAQAGSMFGPIGAAAGAAVGLVSSLASSIAQIHDAKNEKRIQRLQEQIDVLERSYDGLGRSIEKAYSSDASDLIEQQNMLLEQQKVLIQQQIREEQDKKDTDDDRIKEWQQQIEDINNLIEDNKENAIDVIFGEDLKSAIENFADAYANAWASGEDRAKSAKDTVKDMMRQMVSESIKAAIQSSKSMEQIRAKLQQFYADNVFSDWEQDYIYNMAEQLQQELDRQFGWADGLFKDDDEERQGAKKGIATASQESVDENNARLTTIQGHTYILVQNSNEMKQSVAESKEHLRYIREMSQTCLGHLSNIDRNTYQLYETNLRLKRVEASLSDISLKGIRIKA